MKASENGHEEIVKILLSAGAKVDVQSNVSIIQSFLSRVSSHVLMYTFLF